MLNINDNAPSLVAETDQGSFDLSTFKGKNVVVYFYPKDMTPGCTLEAQNFRDALSDFANANTVVVGVSKDSCKRHAKFREKNELNFYLASDENGTICEDWGVWREKKNYGKTYMGIVRSTFLVDTNGKIAQIWDKVRVKGHVDTVLKSTQSLSSS
ncbi:MAG: thioredoxin-dependent thiol peroxidase [Myxococcota bacterium]|nr:thioredoxin-dependent thiol peroxidase [Myxococcota bacterium]